MWPSLRTPNSAKPNARHERGRAQQAWPHVTDGRYKPEQETFRGRRTESSRPLEKGPQPVNDHNSDLPHDPFR